MRLFSKRSLMNVITVRINEQLFTSAESNYIYSHIYETLFIPVVVYVSMFPPKPLEVMGAGVFKGG